MNDPISRCSAIHTVIDALDEYDGGYNHSRAKVVHDALMSLPSEKSERKTGKWIEVHGYCTPGGDPVWACSECGKGIHVYGIEHGTYGADVSDGQWKACPNCGVAMEGEQDE